MVTAADMVISAAFKVATGFGMLRNTLACAARYRQNEKENTGGSANRPGLTAALAAAAFGGGGGVQGMCGFLSIINNSPLYFDA